MSTVANVIEPSLPPDSPPQPRQGQKGILRGFGKNIWALNDQALISATNFATNILTARAMAEAEFGMFSVIYNVLLICNILQSTLITQAHNVLGSLRNGEDYRRYTASTAVQQLIILLIEVVVIVPIVAYGYFRGWASETMLIALVPSIVAWQLQEYVRRVLYTEGRYSAAFWNDVISYGGQALLIVGLYVAHQPRYGGHPFTGAMAFYALAITSAAATVLGVWQLRGSVERPISVQDMKENCHFGKWLTGGELMQWMSSLQMQVWWAAIIIGTVASADLKAAQILYGPARVITFFLGTVLPIRFTRTLKAGGRVALHRSVRQVCQIIVPLAGAYCLLMAAFPKQLLTVLYGPAYATGAANVLRLYSFCAFLGYIQMVVIAALTAGQKTRQIFIGSIAGCIVAIVLGPTCIWFMGTNGAIVNMIIVTLIVTVLYVRTYMKEFVADESDSIAATEAMV